MPTNVTAPLYEGEPMSFPEFAARTARTVSPWNGYERDVAISTPLPDSFESQSGNYYEKLFREDAAELARVASWTPEEAESQAHKHNLLRLKAHLQIVQANRRNLRAYDYMSAQVDAWQAPTEEHEVMRARMQEQLDETFKFTRDNTHSDPPEKVDGSTYREQRIRDLARRVLEVEERLDTSRANVEQASAFAKEFKDSLEGWEDVPVPPRRTLP